MSINYDETILAYFLTFSIFAVSVLIVGSYFSSQLVFAQGIYKNPAIGMKFEYPGEAWDLQENPIGLGMTPDQDSVFNIEIVDLDKLGIPNKVGIPKPTLKDFARYQYTQEYCCSSTTSMAKPLNDNQTTVGQNLTASQMEYTFLDRQGLVVWAVYNGTGYQFDYISNQGSDFSKNIPAIRKVLDSVEFTPIEVEEPEDAIVYAIMT